MWARAHPPVSFELVFCKAASPHPNGPPALAHPWADIFPGSNRAQRESNEAGSVAILESGGGGGSAGGDNAGQPQTLPANGAQLPSGVVSASQPTQQSSGQAESFPPPEDIPSGRDDDVVARQLREAAMSEPDPELREALWDEYRRYTGIAEGDE